ncbi:hypothetical protein KIPB_001883, partial [Kipferlia bialata]
DAATAAVQLRILSALPVSDALTSVLLQSTQVKQYTQHGLHQRHKAALEDREERERKGAKRGRGRGRDTLPGRVSHTLGGTVPTAGAEPRYGMADAGDLGSVGEILSRRRMQGREADRLSGRRGSMYTRNTEDSDADSGDASKLSLGDRIGRLAKTAKDPLTHVRVLARALSLLPRPVQRYVIKERARLLVEDGLAHAELAALCCQGLTDILTRGTDNEIPGLLPHVNCAARAISQLSKALTLLVSAVSLPVYAGINGLGISGGADPKVIPETGLVSDVSARRERERERDGEPVSTHTSLSLARLSLHGAAALPNPLPLPLPQCVSLRLSLAPFCRKGLAVRGVMRGVRARVLRDAVVSSDQAWEVLVHEFGQCISAQTLDRHQ